MSIKETHLGERIIDFSEQAFEEHVRRFRAALHSNPGLVAGRVNEGSHPEQPLRPPL